MKKALAAVILISMIAVPVLAGPLAGLSFAPATNQYANIYFGWQSANGWATTISKSDLSTWVGDWRLGFLWTPTLWDSTTNLRAGGGLNLTWNSNGIQYKGLDIRVGAEKWFTKQVGVYGVLRISSQLKITPIIGFELNFWMPSASEAPAPSTS